MNAIVRADDFEDVTSTQYVEQQMYDAGKAVLAPLDRLVRDQIRAKRPVEERWLRNIRAYHGIYEPEKLKKLKDADQSTHFVKLTRYKTNGWSARIADLLFPTDDKNWGISSTPVPTLTGKAREAMEDAIAKVKEANAAADAGDPTAAQIAAQAGQFGEQVKRHFAAIDEAKRRASWMERTIEDQLIEADYVTQCRDVIEDGCKLGTGILKGPTSINPIRKNWEEKGQAIDPKTNQPVTIWGFKQDQTKRPFYNRVDPWHLFPDMSARTIQEAEFTFERSLPSRKDLKRMARKHDFNKAAVRRLLEQGPPDIISADLSHIAELRALTGEDDAIKNRYIMWEYHGPLEAEDIYKLIYASGQMEAAERFLANADPLEEYRVIIHFIDCEILKISQDYPLDSGDGLYSVWNFEKSEATMFGYGVPELMTDSQDSVNAAWRMMHDNSALSVGPQLIFDKGAITPQDGSWKMRPMKVWLRSTTAYSSPQNKPFDQFEVSNNQESLAGIIQLATAFADEESAMPTIAQGEQGTATQTLGGMSILQNSANVVFRRVIKSWDDELTKPTIRRAYDWNMQFNEDDTIKGDMQVDARGSAVLLVREIQAQNLIGILERWTVHPVLGGWVKARDTAVKTLQTMMISQEDVLKTQDEYDKDQAELAAQPPAPDPEMEMRVQIAQMEQQTRQAIAQMQTDVEVMKVSAATGMSEAEVRAKYDIEELKIGSTERLEAARISIEESRQAQGIDPGQGVG